MGRDQGPDLDAEMTMIDRHIRDALGLWWGIGASLFNSLLDYAANLTAIWWNKEKDHESPRGCNKVQIERSNVRDDAESLARFADELRDEWDGEEKK